MRRAACVLVVVLASLLPARLGSPAAHEALPPLRPDLAARIDDLLARMTLDEKLGQLALLSADMTVTGPLRGGEHAGRIRAGQTGGLFNLWGSAATRRMQEIASRETRLGIPLLLGLDVLHGYRTVFPIPLAEAASFDPALWERTARAAAVEATADGLNWTFAPMLDVTRDPRWGRIAESPGEDPLLAARFAAAKIRGFQGGDLAAPDALAATAKHIGAYGAAEAGRDYNTAEVSPRSLEEVYLPPFRAAVEAGVAAIMPAFHDLAGVPATANRPLLQAVVRGRWGFEGLFVSDYTAIPELVTHGVAADTVEAAAQALAAGVDLDMLGTAYGAGLRAALDRGLVETAAIDAAVRRVLTLKARLGLLDDPFGRNGPTRAASVDFEAHRQLAREAARRSIVLLQNAGGVLPLDGRTRRVAVIGPFCDAPAEMLGPWPGIGTATRAVSLLDGLRAVAPAGTRIAYARGVTLGEPQENPASAIDAAVAVARDADVTLLCLGEPVSMTGEATSRARLDLSPEQRALAEAVMATRQPVIVTLTGGRPLVVPWLFESANAVLATWFLGHEAGHAIADIVFGRCDPSGRLPVTWPRAEGQIPIYYAHRPTGRPPGPGGYTSRYLDLPPSPQFPFGFGLSYTHFRHDGLRLDRAALAPGERLEVALDVTNEGTLAGEETVQLYVRDPVASVARPVRQLMDFAKVALAPGERRTVRFRVVAEQLAFVRADGTFGVEPGTIEVLAGPDSARLQRASFALVVP